MGEHGRQHESYDSSFFDSISGGSYDSAQMVVPMLMDLLGPIDSVVDVGCGTGAWLKALVEHGVSEVLGLDGDYVDRSQLLISPDRFRVVDLAAELPVTGHYDLALCLEVGEHLPDTRAGALLDGLTGMSDVVVFSAAIPFQGGVGHVNEQWPQYWASRFADRGFKAFDVLRPRLWHDPRVAPYFAQNMVLYANQSTLADHPRLAAGDLPVGEVLALVHPGCYLPKARTAARFLTFYERPSVVAARRVSRRLLRR